MTPIKKILTGTTMLSPNAFVLRDPVTIGTYILTSVGVSAAAAGTVIAFGATVAYVVGTIAISVVTNWAINALSPKPAAFSETCQPVITRHFDQCQITSITSSICLWASAQRWHHNIHRSNWHRKQISSYCGCYGWP
jgi:hypothetical protein